MASYIINGPVTLGNASTATTINGNVSLANVSSHQGDTFYTTNTSGLLTALLATNNGILTSSATAPSWIAPGTNTFVLTMVSGSPAWAAPSSIGAYGFSANYTNTTAQTSVQATYNTGTVTTSSGSFNVTGAGTTFTTAMVGGQIVIAGTTYFVTGFSSTTSISVFPSTGINA